MNNCHRDCSNERLEFGFCLILNLKAYNIFSELRVKGEANSEPEDGELVSDSMIGQEDNGQKMGESQVVEHQIRSPSPMLVEDMPEDTLGDMEVSYPLFTMEDNEEGEIEADETTLESSADKLKNDENDEAGFMAKEATIDDIPSATTTTAIQVPPVAEKLPVTSLMAETSVGNQDGSTTKIGRESTITLCRQGSRKDSTGTNSWWTHKPWYSNIWLLGIKGGYPQNIDDDLDDDNDNVLFGLNSGETLNLGSKGIQLMDVDELPKMDLYEEVSQQGQATPPSPAYVSDPMELEHHVPVYVHEPMYPEYLVPSYDDIPVEDSKEDPEEEPINYVADVDDDEDEEEKSSKMTMMGRGAPSSC
nr:nuclear-pore anchor [Tanacetum cinerariifolium]